MNMIEKFAYYLESEAEKTRGGLNPERMDELLNAWKVFNEFLQHEQDIEEKIEGDYEEGEDY